MYAILLSAKKTHGSLPNWAGPLHWHPDFEIATAASGVLDFQVNRQHIVLETGDSIFINGNILHGIKQLSGDIPDPMPNIVFSGAVIAPETSAIYRKYIQPIARCDTLPFILFHQKNDWHQEVNQLVKNIYGLMDEQGPCYEMAISAVNSGKPMDIHRGNAASWVNSAYVWAFYVFLLLGHDHVRNIMRDLLSDGVSVLHAGYRIGKLCALRCFGWNHVAGNDQYFVAEVSKRRHGYVRIFSFGRRSRRYRKSRNGRQHFQYVWR